MTVLAAFAASTLTTGCTKLQDFHCHDDSNCDLSFGGVCSSVPTGNRWCAYPDPVCPSSMRFSDQGVGDGLSGMCVGVVVTIDAGVDAMTDARPPSIASCRALPSTCGASQNDSCCNSLDVVGGTFFRSYDKAADALYSDRSSPATLSSFRLDKYDVTVGRFRAFLAEGFGTQANPPPVAAGTHAYIAGSGWQASWNSNLSANTSALVAAVKCDPESQTWTDTTGANEDRPMNCVTWYEAMAFCAWDGGYLPTEAEWNYAATGGDEQRALPWSSPPESLSMLDSSRASWDCLADGAPSCQVTDLTEVGRKPAGDGRWGHSDLAGDVYNWVLDWYGPYPSPCTDCANLVASPNGPGGTTIRVVRGGGFDNGASALRASYRNGYVPEYRKSSIGIRCAR